MLTDKKIGFIGGGNMAGAMVSGLISSGKIAPECVYVSDTNTEKLESMASYGIVTSSNNSFIEQNCDIVIFCIKPNIFDLVMNTMNGFAGKIYISIAMGISLDYLASKLGSDKKIVRSMPNMPAQVGCGMTVLCPNKNVSEAEFDTVKELFSCIGEYIQLDEKYINAAMALQSSSPAYVFMMIDAMADAGVKHGLPRDVACRLASKAVEGSAKTVLLSNQHPAKLKNDVCSPGGATIEAVHALEECNFATALHKAVDACVSKAENMNK